MRKFTQLFTNILPILFAFCGLFAVNETAWGQWYSTLSATASPSAGGGVCASKNNVSSLNDSDYGPTSTSGKTYCATIWNSATFYAYYKVNTGYKFVNWSTGATSWKISVTADRYTKNPSVTANFAPIDYTIRFYGNNNTGGSTDNLAMKYATAKNLTANGFTRSYSVTYEENGGSTVTDATATYSFAGWATSPDGNKVYNDKENVNNLATTDGAYVDLYAKWTSASVTLPSATKTGAVLEGWYNGDVNVPANKVGEAGDHYTPTASVTLTAKWIDKYTPVMTGANQSIMVDGVQETAFNFEHVDGPVAHISVTSISSVNNGDGKVIEYDAANNKIIAHNAGVATIYFTQAETNTIKEGTSAVYTYTVYKYNSVFANVDDKSVKVGADVASTYSLTYTKPNAAYIETTAPSAAGTPVLGESANFYYTLAQNVTTDKTAGSPDPSLAISYNAGTKTATGKNAGTGTIHLYQPETYKYNAADEDFVVTVTKNANALNCSWGSWSKNVNVETQTGVTFSSNHTQTPIVVEQKSGNTEGSVIATYSSTNNNITSLYNIGEATWSVSQAENYKYEAAETKTLTVNVVRGSSTCYVVDHAGEQSVYSMWGQGDQYCDAIALNGIGESLVSFEAKKDGGTGDVSVVQYSKDNGQNWTTLRSAFGISSDFQQFGPFAFPGLSNEERITHIRFGVSGTTSMISYRYKNIKVTRKKWFKLEDKDGNEISSLTMPTNTLGGNHTTAKFTVNYSTCADQIKVVSNHPHITVSPTSFTSGGDGTQEITVIYASDDSESIDGVITVYTPYDNKTINVHAETEKKTQEIKWSDLFAGETVSLPQTFTSNDAASATSKLPVVYISGNAEIIEVAADSLSFTVVGTGTTTLTALQKGNNTWKSVSDTKTINASNKKIQRIIWNQQFTRSLSVGNEIPLTATVSVLNVATGVEAESNERSAEIVYTCPDANGVIEIFNGTNIRVLGYGNTTITASVAGNEEYEAAAPVTLPVRVREIQTGDCDMPLVYEHTEEIEFFQSNTNEIVGSALAINHANGIPNKLSFDVRGAAWKLGIEYYKGSIQVQQSTDNKVHWSGALTTVSPAKGETASSGEIQLDPNATHIRFVRPSGGQGYHYVGNIQITRLPYIRTEEATINLGNISMGETRNFTIPFSYCSVKGNMTVSKQYDDDGLTTETLIEAECGDMSSSEVHASIQPTAVGPWSNVVTVRDPLSNMFLNVTVNATIQKGDQTITWNPTLDILTTEAPALNAVASSGLTVSYAVTSGNNTVARIDNGQVIILQPGQFTITASQGGNSNYNAAESVEKTFTVTAETLTLLEGPTASDITYGQSLIASTLTGGSVEDSKHNPVTGTFAWQAASTAPNAGDAQVFAVVFVPSANAAWYNALQTTATVNVAKADAMLSWTYAPTELAYNATDVVYTATSASDGAITYSIIDGSEYASIDSESGALTINVPGNTITIQAVQAEGTNYNAPAAIKVDVIIAAAPINEFTNAAGDGDWSNEDNWTSVPTGENPNVIVSGDLEIDGNIIELGEYRFYYGHYQRYAHRKRY